jgi:hypothetical protein
MFSVTMPMPSRGRCRFFAAIVAAAVAAAVSSTAALATSSTWPGDLSADLQRVDRFDHHAAFAQRGPSEPALPDGLAGVEDEPGDEELDLEAKAMLTGASTASVARYAPGTLVSLCSARTLERPPRA